ncbi:MAG: FtsX-like permease family protein [Acidimicrobiia bacterium]|nr:FtsX-like permease family protein [Acidimicrobiia bacterium]
MAAVWACVRSELRQRWKATVVLAVLVGLVGGVAMFGVAGARRTSSAMDRFLAYNLPFDVFVFGEELNIDAVAALPQVADIDTQSYLLLAPSTPEGDPDPSGSLNPFLATGGSAGATSQRPLVVDGRLPRSDETLEVAVNEDLAGRQRVGAGDTLRVWAYRPEQFFEVLEAPGAVNPEGPALDLTVTGVVRHPMDISPDPVDDEVTHLTIQNLYLSPAFAERHGDEVASFEALLGPAVVVRLVGGVADLPAFTEAVRALPGGAEVEVNPADTRLQASKTVRATDLEALALLVFAVLVAIAGLLMVGQSLARQVQLDLGERPALRAMGMTPVQLSGVIVLRALLVGGAGAVVAAVVALVLSPFSPVGLARSAEVDPGIVADLPVLVLGALAVVAIVCARAMLAARAGPMDGVSLAGGGSPVRRTFRVVERLAGAGAPTSAVVGVRMAVEPGRGASAVPVRSALLGATVAVAAVAGGLAFTAALDRLVATPALQGWTWDMTVGDDTVDILDKGRRLLGGNPLVDGFSAISGSGYRFNLGGSSVGVTGLDRIEGEVSPSVVEGRLPERGGEVALGPRTAERLDVSIGDRVEATSVDAGVEPTTFEVVGVALLGPALDYNATIGEGALVGLDDMQELFGEVATAYFLVDYAEGADPDAAFASLQAAWGRQVLRPLPAPDVENLRRVGGLPVTFSVLVAVLGVATLGHTLITSVRRRRRDLAVLRAIGFVRTQVSATVAWQATTSAVIALAVGLPLGVGAGRWAWRVVADGIGAPAAAVTPALAIALTVPAVVLTAIVLAAFPAHMATRTRPANVLRSE